MYQAIAAGSPGAGRRAIGAVLLAAALTVTAAAETLDESASGDAIVAAAHRAAGGPDWVRPRTLYMEGYGLFWRNSAVPVTHDSHRMWRVYPARKDAAHRADGKVRIDSFQGGQPVFQIAFDGEHTYSAEGRIADAADSRRWQANFGFGVIRFALDPGYRVERLADDLVDGRPVYSVKVIDPAGRSTLFGIARDTQEILKVGFDTPRGWHERIYSDFFSRPGVNWLQPGRVRLYYDGIKQNEIIWQHFAVNEPIPDATFVLPQAIAP